MFFSMDSAIECFTYMLNALGYGARPSEFRQISDPQALKKIFPTDILDQKLAGYGLVFPHLQAYWRSSMALIFTITEQHDVSKHRQKTYAGGQAQHTAPAGFYERCGVSDDHPLRILLHPPAEIIVKRRPKLPRAMRTPKPPEGRLVLERIVGEFRVFIEQSCTLARDDARANVKLRHDKLPKVK
jgi:hypothetical protein